MLYYPCGSLAIGDPHRHADNCIRCQRIKYATSVALQSASKSSAKSTKIKAA